MSMAALIMVALPPGRPSPALIATALVGNRLSLGALIGFEPAGSNTYGYLARQSHKQSIFVSQDQPGVAVVVVVNNSVCRMQ